LVMVDLEHWATQTEGWNGADLALLSNQAALEAIRRYRAQGLTDPSLLQIDQTDFAAAHRLLVMQKQPQS